MPRRPRPRLRAPPQVGAGHSHNPAGRESPLQDGGIMDEADSGNNAPVVDPTTYWVEDDEDDLDAPRIAQWIDEYDSEYSSDGENAPGPSNLKTLENDLSDLPLGTLRKAQHLFNQATVDASNGSDSGGEAESSDDMPEVSNLKGKDKAKREWSTKPKKDIAKRSSKHAPMEVTSKKPVTRKRTVVEVKTLQPRDPRFLPLAGAFSAEKFQKSYSFLAESRKRELATLRVSLKQTRKLLSSSPKDLYAERETEVKRIELAVKRAESQVNKDRQDKIEQEALEKMTEEERKKRKEGKEEWHLKKSSQRELLVRARYEALAAEGGKRAVKKAIEKKQKKIGQKEKRSRPYPKGGGLKRGADSSGYDEGRAKRRKVGY